MLTPTKLSIGRAHNSRMCNTTRLASIDRTIQLGLEKEVILMSLNDITECSHHEEENVIVLGGRKDIQNAKMLNIIGTYK